MLDPSHSVGGRPSSIFNESFIECNEEATGEGEISKGSEEDVGGMKGREWVVIEVIERVKREFELDEHEQRQL